MSNILSKAVSNSVWNGIGSLGTAIFGFLLAGLVIRWLGEAEAGFAIAVSTIAGLNGAFSGLGLGSAATRMISRAYSEGDRQTIKQIVGVCLSVALGFGLFGFSLLTFGAPWIIAWAKYEGDSEVGRWYCFLFGLVFLFGQINNCFSVLLDALQRYDWKTKINLAFNLTSGVCGITLLKLFPNILTFGLTQASLFAVQGLWLGWVVTHVLGFVIRPSWNQSVFRQLWSFGRWMYLSQITGSLLIGLDKVCLVSLFGSASLPLYTFAQRIYFTVHSTLSGQASYLFPMLSAQGDQLHAVAQRTEDRLRWFIGLVAGLIYAGLIIAGSIILTAIVNAEFAAKAYFQLLVFCWVGYIHANAIVPFFFGLSKGDAKGNWVFQTLVGVIILPFIVLFGKVLGFQYAVLGCLMIVWSVIYLCKREHPELRGISFILWLLKPLYSSIALMVLAYGIHVVMTINHASVMVQLTGLGMFYLVVLLAIPRLEQIYLNGHDRVETLGRAMRLVLARVGVSGKLLCKVMGVPVG